MRLKLHAGGRHLTKESHHACCRHHRSLARPRRRPRPRPRPPRLGPRRRRPRRRRPEPLPSGRAPRTPCPATSPTPPTAQALADTAAALGGADLLVNNASTLGASPLPPLADLTAEVLDDTLLTNVVAPLALTRLLLPQLLAQPRHASSTSPATPRSRPTRAGAAYGASKAALDQLTRILAAEQPDLRVYAVDPGDMRTAMHQDAFPGEDISDRPEPETVVPHLLALLDGDPAERPLPRRRRRRSR